MICFDIYRPIPVPEVLCLVVKYGSNILFFISSGIPPPLSIKLIIANSLLFLRMINIFLSIILLFDSASSEFFMIFKKT